MRKLAKMKTVADVSLRLNKKSCQMMNTLDVMVTEMGDPLFDQIHLNWNVNVSVICLKSE